MRQLLVSAQLAQAVVDGRKTMTRRLNFTPDGVRYLAEPWRVLKRHDKTPGSQLQPPLPLKYEGGPELGTYGEPGELGRLRPGRFLPAKLSRCVVQVEWLRTELLQDITDEDIEAEGTPAALGSRQGMLWWGDSWTDERNPAVKPGDREKYGGRRGDFAYLWDSINGAGSYSRNVAVQVYSIEVLLAGYGCVNRWNAGQGLPYV